MTDIDFVGSARDGWRIGATFANVFWNVVLFLIRPVGLLTQVFFRKDMGERYFSPLPTAVAAVILFAAYVVTVRVPAPVPLLWLYVSMTDQREVSAFFIRDAKLWIPVLWAVLFAVAAWENRFRSWSRYRNGVKWHSRSMGVPRIPAMGNLFQYTVLIVAAGVLDVMALSWLALLVLLSVAATMMTDYSVARQLYNSVLDALDAELESETLNQAITERLTPKQLNGIALRLPKSLRQFIQNRGVSSGSNPAIAASVIEQKPLQSAAETAI